MDAKVICYDESRPAGSEFSKDKPLPLFRSYFEFNKAIRSGATITFVAEGPQADLAMSVVRELLEKPTNPVEAFLEMVAGGPVRFPQADAKKTVDYTKTLNESPDNAIDERLRAWEWSELADERKAKRE